VALTFAEPVGPTVAVAPKLRIGRAGRESWMGG
jgi:hypothetical protein